MNIGMLTSSFPRHDGDHAVPFIYFLARTLVEEGAAVQIIAPTDNAALAKEKMAGIDVYRFRYMPVTRWQRLTYRNGGIPVTLKRSWVARMQLLPFMFSFWHAARKFRDECDIFHSHWTLAGLVGVWTAKSGNKPTVLTSWGADVNLAKGTILDRVNQDLFLKTDQITAVSDDLKTQIVSLGIPSERVMVMPNAIDETHFKPIETSMARQQLGLPADKLLILFVGSLIERKGVTDLIQAMSIVARHYPDARLLIVGSGYQEEMLKNQAENLGLQSLITFIPAQPAANIPLWMNATDLFVLPSYSEGRPTVLLEAMGCETAVVATNIGGNRELIIPNQTGLLANVQDPKDLAVKIKLFLGDPELRQTVGIQAREFILDQGFTWRENAKRLISVYKRLLK